jgi:demethylmenaquinone methyltransferase/2-methoxy-6-polyprenyl-1,4-benzoquinol methylase
MKNGIHSVENSSLRSEGIRQMFDRISPRYDRLNAILSVGTFNRWHARLLKESCCPSGGTVVDLGTGTGEVLLRFCRRFDISKGVGVDISEKMLEVARRKAARAGLAGRLEFLNRPAEATGLSDTFDCAVTAFVLRNVDDPALLFREMARLVKPGGTVLALDLTMPAGRFLRNLYRPYLTCLLPMIGAFCTGEGDAYGYLASSILQFPPSEQVIAVMRSAGIKDPSAIPLSGGIATLFKGTIPKE